LIIEKCLFDKDTGVYKVVIENKAGVCSHSATVDIIKSKLTFVEKLVELDVKEREEALFVVKISDSNAKVTWLKDGLEIEENEKYTFIEEGYYRKLLIKDCDVSDEGEYTCQLEDVEECLADLIVIELPPEITTMLQDVKVMKGQTAQFTIELTKGDALVRWYKNDEEISFNHRIRLDIDGKRQSLIIQKSKLEDAAVYSCSVRDQTSSSNLIVEDVEGEESKTETAHTVTFTDELSYRYYEKTEEEKEEPTSLSFSTTSTSWMREAEVDPVVRSYTKHTLIGRNEYFFRIWHYASTLFK